MQRPLAGEQASAFHAEAQREGVPRNRPTAELDLRPDDLHARKTLYSAFFPRAGDAPRLLEQRGITTVLLTGTVTEVCVEASARDAFSCGFQVIMLADACLPATQEGHWYSLAAVHRNFGDVRYVHEIQPWLLQRQ